MSPATSPERHAALDVEARRADTAPVLKAVAELAKAKRLDPEWLAGELGLREGVQAGTPPVHGALLIPYWDQSGAPLFERQRNPAGVDPRFRAAKGATLRPYGLWLLADARRELELIITEGESDTWACWASGTPALGLPGDGVVRALEAEHLDGFKKLYIAFDNEEVDGRYVRAAGDEEPVTRLLKRLAEIDFKGQVFRLAPPDGVKDLADLRAADPEAFAGRLVELINQAQAKPLRLPPKWVPPPPRPPGAPRPDASAVEKYIAAAVDGECGEVASARKWRNDTLYHSAVALGTLLGAVEQEPGWAGLLTRGEVERRLTEAASFTGLPDREIADAIKSGLNTGMKYPRDLGDVGQRQARPSGGGRAGTSPPPGPARDGQAGEDRNAGGDGARGGGEGSCAPPASTTAPPPDLPTIEITTAESDINDQAIAALAAHEADLYRRGGALVRVIRDGKAARWLQRQSSAPRIAQVEEPTLQEMMARSARWVTTGPKGSQRPAHPPRWAVQQVARRGTWEGIRHLGGVVEAPALRPDGTVLDTAGYDADTGLLYQPAVSFPPVPPSPTLLDAENAAWQLLDLVSEFPFAGPSHQAAWLAALLTAVARPAIAGPCPLFFFEASQPGTGKTLLAELIGLIVQGREPAVSELTTDEEEMRKTVAAVLLEGERIVLLDNAAAYFGGQPFDALLTATTWKARVLGRSQRTPELPADTTWLATGNNITFRGDTYRRVLLCRLEANTERPEERTGFRYPDLKAHVREHRPALVVAALTILRAHAAAGRPVVDLPEFGTSYGEWAKVVRQAIRWATGADPCAARADITPESRGDVATLGALLAGWAELPGGQTEPGLTVRRVLGILRDEPDRHEGVRLALAEWGTNPKQTDGDQLDARKIGNRLKANRGRVAGGWKLKAGQDKHAKVTAWFVEVAG